MAGSSVGTLLHPEAPGWSAAPFAAGGAIAAALMGVALLVQAPAYFRLRRRPGWPRGPTWVTDLFIVGVGNLVLTYLFVVVYQRLHAGNVPLFYQPPPLCPYLFTQTGYPCDPYPPAVDQQMATQELLGALWGLLVVATCWFTLSGLVLLAGRRRKREWG